MKRKSKNVGNNVNGGSGVATTRGDNQSRKEFMLGDIVWVKIRGSYWWPGQVVDENRRVGVKKTMKKMEGGILTRLYGSYDYMYVDPLSYQSEFENVLKQNNFSIKEILQKALEQGSNKKHTSRKRSNGDPSAKHGRSDVTENPKQNGYGDEKNHKLGCSSHMPEIQCWGCPGCGRIACLDVDCDEPEFLPSTNSPFFFKVDSLFEGSQSAVTRRMRVMRNLGLVAPYGSPFLRKSLRKKGC